MWKLKLNKACKKYNKIHTVVWGVKIFYWAQHRDDAVEHDRIYTRHSSTGNQ